MDGKPAAREETRGEPRNTRFLRNGGVGSADSPESRKRFADREAVLYVGNQNEGTSNGSPGLGNSQEKGLGLRQTRPERVDRSGQ